MKYKFRAEINVDAMLCYAAISRWVDDWNVHVLYLEPSKPGDTPHRVPDVEVTFTVTGWFQNPEMRLLTYKELLWIFSRLEDCHVIVETLQPEESYTGERTHAFEDIIQNWKPDWKLLHQVLLNLRSNIIANASLNGRIASNLDNIFQLEG